MSIQKLRPSYTFTQDRLAELRSVIPEVFADGKINLDVLKEAVGAFLEEEGPGAEHFGLFWPGKRDARRLAALPSKGTLRVTPNEGINEDATSNIYIEGDNLEVLKLLQKSYASRIKMIYIDPPYNTGNDFVYKDDFREPLEDYLRKTGQVDEEGQMLTTNSRADGRFHSNWLSMIYPRLRLAQTLLQDGGVIFVSIDDTEMAHLKLLMNEIFGEENFVGIFVWQSKKGGGSDTTGVVRDQEYIICFSKPGDNNALTRIAVNAEPLDRVDKKGTYRRGRELNKWGSNSRREDRPTMYFPIPGPNGEDVYPLRNDGSEGRWRWGKQKMLTLANNGDAEFVKRPNGTYIVYEKIRSVEPRAKPYRTWLTDVGATADGSKTVKELFGGRQVHDFPKPLKLMKSLLEMGTNANGDLVLDFFAGSCTTAQAVLELNREDGGDRHFICVQIPEATPTQSEARKAGYNTVAEVGKERLRRVIANMQQTAQPKLLEQDRDEPEDLGFKVFKLSRSNFKAWQDYQGESIQELETLFDRIETPLIERWSEEDLLTEILLLQGFPLDSTIIWQDAFTQNTVLLVDSDTCAHRLSVCLDNNIADDTISQLQLNSEDVFVCLDSALTDQSKMHLTDVCTLNII